MYCVPELCVLWTPKYQIDADFARIIVQILILLIKQYNLGLFQGEISKYQILKNISTPGKKVFYSRWLRNAGLFQWFTTFSTRAPQAEQKTSSTPCDTKREGV